VHTLAFRLERETEDLDSWELGDGFGGLKSLKQQLATFDQPCVGAQD
jgi:hypothetical protein